MDQFTPDSNGVYWLRDTQLADYGSTGERWDPIMIDGFEYIIVDHCGDYVGLRAA